MEQSDNNDPITILKELIAINSINPFKAVLKDSKRYGIGNEQQIAEYLEKKLVQNGFKVQKQIFQKEITLKTDYDKIVKVPLRYNIIAEKGEGEKSLLFFAHMDTVEIKEGWDTEPLEAVTKVVDCKEKIYGLGAYDMKAGIAAILSATENVWSHKFKIKIVFVADEEYWSFGTEALLKTDFLNDVKLIVVPEISDTDKMFDKNNPNIHYPNIILGRRGRAEYEFKVRGKSAHGAHANLNKSAVNAVHEAIKLQHMVLKYCSDSELYFTYQDIKVKNSSYINYHHGGKGVISIPEYSRFLLDRSFIVGENAEGELQKLTQIAIKAQKEEIIDPRAKIEINLRERPTPYCQPYFIDPDKHPEIREFSNLVKQFYGGYNYSVGYSVADENRLATKNIPIISFGPEGNNCHSPNEWVNVNSLLKLADFFKMLIKEWDTKFSLHL